MVAGAEEFRHARFDTARVAGLIRQSAPDDPVALFRPDALKRRADVFQRGFPGKVSYAVKANPSPEILRGLSEAGVTTFDVASVAEMRAVREVAPQAWLHYHNPIRSAVEIKQAKAFGVASWSVDRSSELRKLGSLSAQTEIAVRLTLDRGGAAYSFGSKFGATPDKVISLLQMVQAMGCRPSLAFHPGTQCTDPQAWCDYIRVCADIADAAGVRLSALNVGGGFPAAHTEGDAVLTPVFAAIGQATIKSFGSDAPTLWCEPGRAMVSDALWLLLRVKARDGATLYLNDGLYGALGEWRDMPVPGGRVAFDTKGRERVGTGCAFTVFGPTCDSLDRIPESWDLPETIAENDYILLRSAGAYSTALVTGFNGYGTRHMMNLGSVVDATGQGCLAG